MTIWPKAWLADLLTVDHLYDLSSFAVFANRVFRHSLLHVPLQSNYNSEIEIE